MPGFDPYAPYAPPAPQAPPPPAYPYAAPYAGFDYRTHVAVPAGQARRRMLGPALRTWKLVLGIAFVFLGLLALGLFIAAIASAPDAGGVSDEGAAILAGAGLAMGLGYLLLIASSVMNLVWIYRFWSWLPPEQRHAKLWKSYISPGAAVGFMLVPYFNLFWMFVIYFGACDAIDRLRVAYPTSKAPPRNLAIAMIIVSFIFFPAAPILQYLYDKELEALAMEMEGRLPPPLA